MEKGRVVKQPQILVRTRKNKQMEKLIADRFGNPLSEEDQIIFRKKVDFMNDEFKFPHVNPIDLVLPSYKGNGKVKIANYLWPAKGERKGVVHWIHGYGDYVGRHGFLAKAFAEQGYDFCGID